MAVWTDTHTNPLMQPLSSIFSSKHGNEIRESAYDAVEAEAIAKRDREEDERGRREAKLKARAQSPLLSG